MREIKFRAWIFPYETILCRKVKGEMITKLLEYSNNEISYRSGLSVIRLTQYEHKFELMQYTGLKDCKGKEIYEGDIVKGNSPSLMVIVPMCGGLSIHPVRNLGQQHNELIAMPTNDVQTASWLGESEIFGNIYENPELLEVK